MAEGGFRLPGSTYEELKNVIVAYGTRDMASNPGDVGKLDSVHRSSATRTNGFLVEIGVLRGEREKLVTPRGRELALALESEDEERTRRVWRQVVSTSEFLQNVLSAVKIRQGIAYETVQSYIAHAAGQPRNKPVMIGSSTVIEVMKAANLLKEEESGRVYAVHEIPTPDFLEVPDEVTPDDQPTEEEVPLEDPVEPVPDEPSETTSVAPASSEEELPTDEGVDVAVKVHLHVRCEAKELDEISPKLTALIRTLKGSVPDLTVNREVVETESRETETQPSKPLVREKSLDLDEDFGADEEDYDDGELDDFFSSSSSDPDEGWRRRGSSGRSF